jgi:hypothetical protein
MQPPARMEQTINWDVLGTVPHNQTATETKKQTRRTSCECLSRCSGSARHSPRALQYYGMLSEAATDFLQSDVTSRCCLEALLPRRAYPPVA